MIEVWRLRCNGAARFYYWQGLPPVVVVGYEQVLRENRDKVPRLMWPGSLKF
jgi:hypothetical protein